MAWQANNDISVGFNTMGAKALQASTTITSSTQSTGVFTGRGLFQVEVAVTAFTPGVGFDIVLFWVERNTIAAPTTWQQLGCLAIGDATGVGLGAQTTDTYPFLVNNTGDNQLRLNVQMLGSAASVTYSANVYPARTKDAA